MLEMNNRLKEVYKTLSAGMTVTFLSCMLSLNYAVNPILVIVAFILTALLCIWKPNKYTFFTYSFTTGMLLSLSVLLVSVSTVMAAMVGTLVVFLGLTCYVIKTGKDFSNFLKPLLYMLTGMIVLQLLNIFFIGNETLEYLLNVTGVIVFAGFILADTSEIMKGNFENKYSASLSMHLNIVNLFLSMMGILDD